MRDGAERERGRVEERQVSEDRVQHRVMTAMIMRYTRLQWSFPVCRCCSR